MVLFEHMGMEEQLVLPLVEPISRIPRAVASATTEGGMRPAHEYARPRPSSIPDRRQVDKQIIFPNGPWLRLLCRINV